MGNIAIMRMPNEITFCEDKYQSKEAMFKEIGEFIRLVSDAGYTCKTRYEEPGLGIFTIEFDYDSPELANNLLKWLTYDEAEYLETMVDSEDYVDKVHENNLNELSKFNYAKYAEETKEIYNCVE